MRRWLVLVLALLMLCASLPAAATQDGAQARAMLVKRWQGDVEWVQNTGLLQVKGANDAYGMYDVSGSMLTGTVYADFLGLYDSVCARDTREGGLNGYGLLSTSGQVLIPFQYGTLQPMTERWTLGCVLREAGDEEPDGWQNGQGYVVERMDVYYGETPRRVASLERSEYQGVHVDGDYISVWPRVSDAGDGLVIRTYDSRFELVSETPMGVGMPVVPRGDGVVEDADGYWLTDSQGSRVELPYDLVDEFVAGYACVGRNGKRGFIDSEGREAVPVAFDVMMYFGDAPRNAEHGWGTGKSPVLYGGVVLCCDGEVCFADLSRSQVWRSGFSTGDMDLKGLCGVLLDSDFQVHVSAVDGANTVISQLSPEAVEAGRVGIDSAEYTGGMFLKWMSEEGLQGMMDWHGNEVIPCRYADLAVSADGRYVLADAGDGSHDIYQLTYPTWQLPEDDTAEFVALAQQYAASAPAAETGDDGAAETGDGGATETGDGGATETGDGGAAETGDGSTTETGDGGAAETGDGNAVETGDGSATETGSDVDAEGVSALLLNARTLLELNADANRADAALMLESALAELGDGDAELKSMIESALAGVNAGGRLGGSAAIRQLDAALEHLSGRP